MPSPYGHQQGGTRRKKNRKGKSNSLAKERKMMRGGQVADVAIFWERGGIVSRKKNIVAAATISLLGQAASAATIYKMIWIPSSGLITFDLTPIAVLNLLKSSVARQSIIKTMDELIQQVFGAKIEGLLTNDNTLGQTVICFTVQNDIIQSGTKTINGGESTTINIPAAAASNGNFGKLKVSFDALNKTGVNDTINLDVLFPEVTSPATDPKPE